MRPLGQPCPGIEPGPKLNHWLFAAALEELERLSAFSSFYTGPPSLARLEAISAAGFASPEMQRRLQLVRTRFGAGQVPSHSGGGHPVA